MFQHIVMLPCDLCHEPLAENPDGHIPQEIAIHAFGFLLHRRCLDRLCAMTDDEMAPDFYPLRDYLKSRHDPRVPRRYPDPRISRPN
jgi:hypothetical protein